MSRRMIWVVHAARMEDIRNAYKVLVGKAEGKKPLGRPRSRGKIILEGSWGNRVERCGLDASGS
jgi:hypothetical protein